MLYKLAHLIKNRFSFVWDSIEWINATLFSVLHASQLRALPSLLENCSNDYIYRLADLTDVDALVEFFREQPENAFEFFKPHEFDAKSISKIIKNKAFLTFIVCKDNQIVGYFFLRCFINGKCFRGKMVHNKWQGRGSATRLGKVTSKITNLLGLRMFGSISPDNLASLQSAKASNDIRIHRTLDNGYYYIEFLPQKK